MLCSMSGTSTFSCLASSMLDRCWMTFAAGRSVVNGPRYEACGIGHR